MPTNDVFITRIHHSMKIFAVQSLTCLKQLDTVMELMKTLYLSNWRNLNLWRKHLSMAMTKYEFYQDISNKLDLFFLVSFLKKKFMVWKFGGTNSKYSQGIMKLQPIDVLFALKNYCSQLWFEMWNYDIPFHLPQSKSSFSKCSDCFLKHNHAFTNLQRYVIFNRAIQIP